MFAWLCLFFFGLDMAVHALGPIVCAAEGDRRVEWACEKDERGACLATTLAADATSEHSRGGRAFGHDQPAPCRDEPVDDDHDQAHHLLVQTKQSGHAKFTLPPLTMAVLPPLLFNPPARLVRAAPDAIARPPDVLGRLATIVMIV
ncbi:MAG: hypothetical protein ACKVS8_09375 [Phycisphaerales bacterium]